MNDLTDEEVNDLLVHSSALKFKFSRSLVAALDELQRHRDTMKRLEEWAVQLEDGSFGSIVGKAIALQLRNRIRGQP